jgi:TonB-linked SusC/RagA family outer membrane protein
MLKKIRYLIFLFLIGMQVTLAQQKTVSGTVRDTKGETLPGVNVLIVGTQRGTQTDINGRYSLLVSPKDTLLFSFIGMHNQSVLVGGKTKIDIVMEEEAKALDQVVVVGYGVQKKESVVGAVAKTDGKNLVTSAGTNSNLTNAITGLIPGVITVKTSGRPGGSSGSDAPTQIFIRGISTWNGGQPLILVDGVERPMMDVDPNEVTSMSVLKDASATAVFGVKGANGVILITTKRGKKGRPKLTFDASVSVNSLSKMAELLGSYDANYLKDLAIENGIPADPNSWNDYVPFDVLKYYRTHEYPELYPDVNWMDEMTKPVALSQKYNLSASGGTDFVKYFLSLGYLNEGDILETRDYGQGYVPQLGYRRYNYRSNLDFKLTRSTTFSVNFGGFIGKQDNIPGYNIMRGVYLQPPDLYPVRYSDGIFADYENFAPYTNPVVTINFSGLKHTSRNQVNSDFILKQKLDFITKGLSVGTRVSYDTRSYTSGPNIGDGGTLKKYIMPEILDADPANYDDYIIYLYPKSYTNQTHGYNFVKEPVSHSAESSRTNVYRGLYYNAQVNYARHFGKHAVTGLGLFSREERASGSEFTHFREDWVGRVTYNYDLRYFLEFNGAYNGSEKFDRDYRFGFFPSLAGGWLISNEKFFQDALPFVNHLKVRFSMGKVGNDAGIARWQYVGGWENTGSQWSFGSPYLQKSSYPIYLEDVVPNPNIHWETAEKQNLGIEAGVWDNLISVNFELFWEDRYDMFIRQKDRLNNVLFGRELPAANIGELEAHGWEGTVKFTKTFMNGMSFRANLSISKAVNKIIYREDPELRPDYMKQAGYPLGQVRSVLNQGIIQNWDEVYTGVNNLDNTFRLPGDFRQVDYNADGVVDNYDVVPYGYTPFPEYNYSGIFNFGYKGLGVMVQLYGIFNVTSNAAYGGVGNAFTNNFSLVSEIHMNDSWSPEMGRTTDADYPALRYNTTNYSMGNYWMQDFSNLKLQNAQVYYMFKGQSLKHIGISQLKVYVNGNNLYTWSKLPYDFDKQPPLQQFSYALSYPRVRSFNFGVNVVF